MPGRMLVSLPDSRCSTPVLQPGAPGYPPLGALARRLPPSPAARGKAGTLAASPAPGRCFPPVQGRAARAKPETFRDVLPALRCHLVGSQISPYRTFLKTWQSQRQEAGITFRWAKHVKGPEICVEPSLRTFPSGSSFVRVLLNLVRKASRRSAPSASSMSGAAVGRSFPIAGYGKGI